MQIICANSLPAKEEDSEKIIRGHQKERGNKRIINIGDHLKCPQCSRIARVIWISQDGKQAGIRCAGHHSQMIRGISRFGSAARPQSKAQKNMVFLVDVEMAATFVLTER